MRGSGTRERSGTTQDSSSGSLRWTQAAEKASDLPVAPNPLYGRGIYRRRILVDVQNGRLEGQLEDTHHALRCCVEHDGGAITRIGGTFVRSPTTACGGAEAVLQRLIGERLEGARQRLAPTSSAHCTHLLDLALVLIWTAAEQLPSRRYDLTIPDDRADPVEASVTVNGKTLLSWHVHDNRICDEALGPRPIFGGFTQWAMRTYQGESLEAALMLQKGCLVAIARRFDTSNAKSNPRSRELNRRGVCFALSPPRDGGHPIPGNVRDLTDGFG